MRNSDTLDIMREASVVNVLFVCMGNICRSPTAEGVFRHLVAEAGHSDTIAIDSSGMADWHAGKAPDSRSQAAARQRGIEIGDLRARQTQASDFHRFDYVIGMDDENMADLAAICPAGREDRMHRMLDFATDISVTEVPDPYYGASGFDDVLDLIENASRGLLARIIARDL